MSSPRGTFQQVTELLMVVGAHHEQALQVQGRWVRNLAVEVEVQFVVRIRGPAVAFQDFVLEVGLGVWGSVLEAELEVRDPVQRLADLCSNEIGERLEE